MEAEMILPIYFISTFLLLILTYVTFRILHRRDYRRMDRQSPFSMILGALVFFLWGGFPYIYGPVDWPTVHVSTGFCILGWVILVGGLAILFSAMTRLGLRRSVGVEGERLEETGFYRISRNPQVIGCSFFAIGFAILWPSLYALGWVLLLYAMLHMMVLTEEEHLCQVYGEAYVSYCKRVPRYLGLRIVSRG
jgi:protein-S-isoprenylcysteine O-methyltransferase Ste14